MSAIDRRAFVARLGVLGAVPFALTTVGTGDAFAADAKARGGGSRKEAAGLAGAAPRPLPSAFEHASPADVLVRMRCAPDGGWAMWLYSGALVVKPEGQTARTVMRIEGFSFNRATRRPDGTYEYQLDETGYYCDPATGQPLDAWTNPFTGRETRVVHYRSPQKLYFDRTQVLPGVTLPPDAEFRGELTRLAEVGGVVACTEDLYAKLPARAATADRPAAPVRISTSLATHISSAADLARPAGEWLDSTLAYGTMNTTNAWLGMGDVPALQNMRLVGRKLRADAFDAIPAWLLERVRRDNPSILDVPKS
jgi:hypothetical protein